MSIAIDSMIWIYYFDTRALEHQNVKNWFIEKDGVLNNAQRIIINTIIPMEVIHAISRIKKSDFSIAYNAARAIIALDNVKLVELTAKLMSDSFFILGKYRNLGIGGRDATILAAMFEADTWTLATHDINLLSITDIKRIDPVFSPPLVFEKDEKFNYGFFKKRMKQLINKNDGSLEK